MRIRPTNHSLPTPLLGVVAMLGVMCVAPSVAHGQGSAVVLSESDASLNFINCEASLDEGVLRIETGEQEALIDFGLTDAAKGRLTDGPAALEFSMRIVAETDLGESIVYWVHDGETKWGRFVRVPYRPDGEWRRYRVPISTTDRVAALRFSLGAIPHQREISDVRLTSLDRRLAPTLSENVPEDSAGVRASVGDITVSFSNADRRYTIADAATGRVWRSEPLDPLVSVYGLDSTSPDRFCVRVYDHFSERSLAATTAVEELSVVRFSLEAEDYQAPLSAARFFPPRFATEMDHGHLVFCDRSCGVLLDQSDATYASWPLRVYGNTNCLDMPWVGLFDEQRGDGLMLMVDTPADAEVAFVADGEGRHWPEVRWLASLDEHRYARHASIHLTRADGYVEMARRYREQLQSQGRFKTLAEKAAEKPEVERLRGAPALWGGRYPTKFIRQMRPLGVTRGVVSNCRDAGILRWLNDQGFLTGRYDSYTDFVQGPQGFQTDDVDSAAIVTRPGGAPKHGWKKRSGEQMYWRSSAAWAAAEASYTPQELAERPYNARFVDVAAAAELLEDYHPDHTVDRRQDLANRRALFAKMNSYGLVLGTEHGNDWVADQVEYFEGTMSGPFWWSSWPAGYLDRPKREQLSDNYLKYGMGYEHRVPLWELVFHDCVNTTWYWGDTAGLLYDAAPELADRKDLFNLLYGTMPLFWMNNAGYRHPEETHRMLRSFHDTCEFHRVVGFEQLVSHEFLSEDRAVQRTRFANGAEVVVNFADEPREHTAEAGAVLLAAGGYLVTGPGFAQSRLQTPRGPETVIKKDGYLTVESDGSSFVHGVKTPGRLTAFRVGEDRWNLFVDPDVTCEVDIPSVTGWNPRDNLQVCYMDDVGEIHRPVAQPEQAERGDGVVRFRSGENAWRFALVRSRSAKNVDKVASE